MGARLAFSSGPDGRGQSPSDACRRCGASPCRCGAGGKAPTPARQAVRVRRERGGRRGKTVTVAEPLSLARADAIQLLSELKRECGAGGALKDVAAENGRAAFALELQGDHVATIVERLVARGFRAKRAGG